MGRCKECEEQARLLGMSGEREADLKGRIAELERVLESIAANTCCDGCQQAARVAKTVLGRE